MIRRLGVMAVVRSGLRFVAASSRPGSSIWSVGDEWIVMVGVLVLALLAATVDRVVRRVVCGDVRSSERDDITVGLFGLFHAIAVAVWLLALPLANGRFTQFADEVRGGPVPRTDSIRIGPWTYDRLCVRDDVVTVWHSADDFMSVSAIRIDDDAVTRVSLREGNEAFACDRARRR